MMSLRPRARAHTRSNATYLDWPNLVEAHRSATAVRHAQESVVETHFILPPHQRLLSDKKKIESRARVG